jgi:hypothetical protein
MPGRDFAADEIGVVADARLRAFALAEPTLADQREQHVRASDRALDDIAERLSGVDVVDVDEDGVGAEAPHERVVDRAGVARRVVATVADEDPGLGHVSAPAARRQDSAANADGRTASTASGLARCSGARAAPTMAAAPH